MNMAVTSPGLVINGAGLSRTVMRTRAERRRLPGQARTRKANG